jgi:hypothetical protein
MDKQLEDYIKVYYLQHNGFYYHKISFGKPQKLTLEDVKREFEKRQTIKN